MPGVFSRRSKRRMQAFKKSDWIKVRPSTSVSGVSIRSIKSAISLSYHSVMLYKTRNDTFLQCRRHQHRDGNSDTHQGNIFRAPKVRRRFSASCYVIDKEEEEEEEEGATGFKEYSNFCEAILFALARRA